MYSIKNVDIMKEVDSFIAQAKLEGDISGSSSSNLSINVQPAKTAFKEDQILEQKIDKTSKIETEIQPCKETAQYNESETTDVRIDNNPTTNCFIENEKQDFLTKKSPQAYDINLNTNMNTVTISKGENNRMKSSKVSQNNITGQQNLKADCDWKYDKTDGREDEDSCDSSFVDLASDSNKSKLSYVMWLQERRSKQKLLQTLTLDEQSEKKNFQSEKVHLHQVNSALFWERWIDNIFELYDQWVNTSESEDNSNVPKRRYSSKNPRDKRHPIKIRSEPTLRTQSDETMKVNNLKYKCPSYVDWLVQRRQEKTELSDSEEVIEPKKDNYWSSLYGKVAKSLSSIFLTVSKSPKEEGNLPDDEPETQPLVSKSPSGSPRAMTKGLRRSHSHACSHSQHNFCQATKHRFRHLSQDSVGSPVLTDQLVELVCKTLSPDSSSSDSTSQEEVRKRKPYRRISKRKS